jgi:hypothetical protein
MPRYIVVFGHRRMYADHSPENIGTAILQAHIRLMFVLGRQMDRCFDVLRQRNGRYTLTMLIDEGLHGGLILRPLGDGELLNNFDIGFNLVSDDYGNDENNEDNDNDDVEDQNEQNSNDDGGTVDGLIDLTYSNDGTNSANENNEDENENDSDSNDEHNNENNGGNEEDDGENVNEENSNADGGTIGDGVIDLTYSTDEDDHNDDNNHDEHDNENNDAKEDEDDETYHPSADDNSSTSDGEW